MWHVFGALVVLGCAAATFAAKEEQATDPDCDRHKHQRRDPKMVVFGDSLSDAGRRFSAPGSFDFPEIGKFPWRRLYDAEDPEETIKAYLPNAGSATNGKVWPQWLHVPDELNYGTSSGSATHTFRSLEPCLGYTGDGEDFPTGTLDEQILAYFNDHGTTFSDYTHVIALGGNDITNALRAMERYSVGGAGYEDPVPFDNVFTVNGTTGAVDVAFEPVITEIVTAWVDGVAKLIAGGVTGRILLANVGSLKALPPFAGTEEGEALDEITQALRDAAAAVFAPYSQVRIFDAYSLFAAIIDEPEIFEDEGFSTDTTACLEFNFQVDFTAEIMNTQDGRSSDCPETCALCADGVSPCQQCITEGPSAFVCDDADTRLFWDPVHITTSFAKVLGKAVRQCAKDTPDYTRAWVEVVCPNVS